MELKCQKCGNDKNFYRYIAVKAKLELDKNGEDLQAIFDVEENDISENWTPIIYCRNCNHQIGIKIR